ncbi:MAG: response regulator, partial [Desulfatitalea sp.]|nr:response regulator [Desulfatitalea sp.]
RQKETLQAQLLKAKKMEAIGTLAGGIAHDFNNLMMGIQGNASLLRLELDAHPELAERLEMIEAFVQSGAHLTRQLLGFARMGKYEVRSTDINALVRTSAEMFARTRKELHVRCNCQAEVWPVQVDRGQIEQVLLNLFINAWQSMPDGGSITIDTRNEVLDDGYSAAHGLSPGRYVRISVTDTGSGIDPAIRERIFDPFFSTKTRQRGTGLGLASAYGIIQNHGGLINVYSEPGHGSTFNIYLQASDQAPVALESPREDMLTGSETLLLVDDEPHIVSITQRMLAKLGYQVFTAEGGEAALEVVRKHRAGIDLVILDMIMPDMGGGETFDHLRRIDPEIKVLLASGYSINGEASEILARGCNGFLQKPFNLTVLSREVRRVLDGVNESV